MRTHKVEIKGKTKDIRMARIWWPSNQKRLGWMSDADGLAHYLNALHEMAEVSIDITKPIRLYIRSAESVYKQACIYRSENDLEKAFILFLKYSNLVLKELPRHADYASNVKLTASLRANLLPALDVLEAAKPILLQRYKEMEAEKAQITQREREFAAARKREDEAKLLADKAAKSQEEARRQRLFEMQKLDLQKAYANNTLLDRSISGDSMPVGNDRMAPSPTSATSPISPPPPEPKKDIAPTPIVNSIPSPKALYYLENGMPVRSIGIPSSIVTRFLALATENTRKNLETCGVLAGVLSHDSFTITTLIIPKQVSTSDTVAMLNEEEIFDVQDRRELLTLGWIHTHPTQQCFMSSVDLHTHFPYQLLIAEAIAIVAAPTQTPNYGIFRLTDPPGIGVISKCPQRGFHQHPSDRPIYKEISGPDGHAKFSSQLSLEVIDLR